ncbi:MAG: spermidine synthase [Actinomycetota bacterium]
MKRRQADTASKDAAWRASRPPIRTLSNALGFGSVVPERRDGDGAPGERVDPRLRLVALSFLMLFVELALIRWTGSNVLYLSYFSNFVLLGSFLGIGLGFLRARSRVHLFPLAPVLLALLVVFVRFFPVVIDRSGDLLVFFGSPDRTGLPVWVTLPVVFVGVAAVMAAIGEGVARTFARFPPLQAYRLDTLGSIGGIAVFSVLSFTGAPPVVWGAVAAGLMLLLLGRRARLVQVAGAVTIVVVLAVESLAAGASWSPYYKVTLRRTRDFVSISVNGVPHQIVTSVAWRRRHRPFYFLPYRHMTNDPPHRVLVVGAGSGGDVAVALAEGAGHVDAVEIDPRLAQLGKELNPDHPYQDPRVSLTVDDGRAFLERTDRRYDLILFGLPDSLTLVSGQSSIRLESYLFTEQAIASARDHLAPGGVFAMYNSYREQWLVGRLASTLDEAFGRKPCVDFPGGTNHFAVLTDSASPGALRCPPAIGLATAAGPATDDHPFVYLRHRTIPAFYLLAIALILLASALAVRGIGGRIGPMRRYVDLFFMGAAFLLLEAKSVVQFALLFGTTWVVNALVFAGVLVSVLVAIEVARRVRIRRPARLYVWLLAALGVAWAVSPEALLGLPLVPRFLVAVAVAFAPITIANLVFAERFRGVGSSTVAFGANLLGAMVGGVLEYLSLIVGYRSLLLLVAALYGLAFLTGRGHLTRSEDGPVRRPEVLAAGSGSRS